MVWVSDHIIVHFIGTDPFRVSDLLQILLLKQLIVPLNKELWLFTELQHALLMLGSSLVLDISVLVFTLLPAHFAVILQSS